MREQTDENGIIWSGPYTIDNLKYFENKENICVWFKGIEGCTWNKPHYYHRISLKKMIENYEHIKDGIFVQKDTISQSENSKHSKNSENSKRKNSRLFPIPIWVAIITVLGSIIATSIGLCKKSNSKIDTKGNGNIIVDGNNNKVILEKNKEWEWQEIRGIEGNDFVDIKIAFKIVTDEFRWKFKSHELLANGKEIREELPKYLDNLPDFHNAIGLIAVGMSSQEGNLIVEEDRAMRRAESIILALRPHSISEKKEIYKLNMGRFKNKTLLNKDETSFQRRVVIVAIMDKSDNISLEKLKVCLKDAFSKSELSFKEKYYSAFRLYPYSLDYRRIEY